MLSNFSFLTYFSQLSAQIIELNVETPPIMRLSMTISNRPVSLTSVIINGQSIRITCATWGNPLPSISWFRNGVVHVQSRRHQYTNQNASRTYASEDLYIGWIMFSDMVCSNCLPMVTYISLKYFYLYYCYIQRHCYWKLQATLIIIKMNLLRCSF